MSFICHLVTNMCHTILMSYCDGGMSYHINVMPMLCHLVVHTYVIPYLCHIVTGVCHDEKMSLFKGAGHLKFTREFYLTSLLDKVYANPLEKIISEKFNLQVFCILTLPLIWK